MNEWLEYCNASALIEAVKFSRTMETGSQRRGSRVVESGIINVTRQTRVPCQAQKSDIHTEGGTTTNKTQCADSRDLARELAETLETNV